LTRPTHDILRIEGVLPPGIGTLADVAEREGVRNMRSLIDGWTLGTERFDQNHAALFGAFSGVQLIGIGGVTPEPALTQAFRVRRFYVHPDFRRHGAARALAETAIAHAFHYAATITCNARASIAAAPFWQAIGFQAVDAEGWTHQMCR
jgi:GNAT superfamily N-acetyltransferase